MGTCCSRLEQERKPLPKNNTQMLHPTQMLETPNTENQVATLVKIPPMASWPTPNNLASSMMDMSSRSSMRTEEDFMDGASIRKLSDASASSISSTRVEEYCHYNRLSYQPSEDSQCYPVEITLGDHTFDAASLPNFSWMQRPVNNFNVPTGKRQTERENLIHYVMRYVMNG